MKINLSIIVLLFFWGNLRAFAQSMPADTTAPAPVVTQDLYITGQRDAELHYRKYKGAGVGTLIVSLVSPLVGLVPAIGCSATMPKEANLGYPKPEVFGYREYYQGYTKKAKKIKQRKVWSNWAIGFGVNLVATLIIGAAQQ